MIQKILVKTDKNGTKYYHCKDACGKCGGTGYIAYYSHIDVNEFMPILLKGTIKEHSEYKGIKQTALTRCKLEEVK